MSRTCYILYHNFDVERHYPYFRAKQWRKISKSNSAKSESELLKGEKLYCIFGASVNNSKYKQYFLWNVTDVVAYEYVEEEGWYCIYGKARYLKEPIHLNPIDGFEHFKKTACNFIGLQNCYSDPFRKVLESAEYIEPDKMDVLPEKWVYDFENKYEIKYRESFLERNKIKFYNEAYYEKEEFVIPEYLLNPPPKTPHIVKPEPKLEIKHVDVSWVKVGEFVNNAFYGNGEVVEFVNGYVKVKFANATKEFSFPNAFDEGFLKHT